MQKSLCNFKSLYPSPSGQNLKPLKITKREAPNNGFSDPKIAKEKSRGANYRTVTRQNKNDTIAIVLNRIMKNLFTTRKFFLDHARRSYWE